jgi:hypothetical protein
MKQIQTWTLAIGLIGGLSHAEATDLSLSGLKPIVRAPLVTAGKNYKAFCRHKIVRVVRDETIHLRRKEHCF